MANNNMNPKEMTVNATHWFVMLAETGLAVRVVFEIFGAQAGSSGFVLWLYQVTGTLLTPFRNVFRPEITSRYALDFVALFAMVVYMVFGLLVIHWANSWKANK